MAGIEIDIALDPELQEAMTRPRCADVRLPKPSIPGITLPNGGQLKGVADFTKGIPDDCSMAFSLIAQLGPFMASIECLMRVLALIEPLTGVIKAVPDPVKLAETVPKFLEAADNLKDCILVPTPLNLIPFIRDVIALIAKLLRCLVTNLKSILSVITDLNVKIAIAYENGDGASAELLECSLENAQISAEGMLSSVETLTAIMSMMSVFLELAQIEVEIPTIDTGGGLEDIENVLDTLEAVASGLEDLARSLGAE